MFTKVYMCDIGWSLGEIWHRCEALQFVTVEGLLTAYLHERHLFPLTPDLNRNYEILKATFLRQVANNLDNIYHLLDNDIDLLRVQPMQDRHLCISAIQVIGSQLYLYLL